MHTIGIRAGSFALLLLAACGGNHSSDVSAPQGTTTALPACYTPSITTAQDIATYDCSWAHGALTLQRGLAADTPFGDTTFTSTHNSFNSRVYPGPSSRLDPNQLWSLSDQLSLDIDSIELDLHWVYNAAALRKVPVVCHGLGAEAYHLGCTPRDNTLKTTLAEIATWLASPAAQGRVIWIDLENVLADPAPLSGSTPSAAGHAEAIAQIESTLGPYLFRPPADGACHPLPLELTRRVVLAAGKQVVLTSDCGIGNDWSAAIFDIRSVRTQKANDGFAASPACGAPSFSADDYALRHTRIWEDNSQLSALSNRSLQAITADDLRAMLACGINTVSLEQWTASDARYPALVWSWAPQQPDPAAGHCALLNAEGHFEVGDCAASHRFACHDGASWTLPVAEAGWDSGDTICAQVAAEFAVPASAQTQAALTQAAGGAPLWVNYRANDDGRQWHSATPRF